MITDELALAAVALTKDDPAALARVMDMLDVEEVTPALADAALAYAAAGIACFPLVAGQKRPLTTHGLHDASIDPATVAAWWARWPQANIGLPTGGRFDVIDVDGPTGYLSLADLRDQGHIPDLLGQALTPRGTHLYIAPTGDGNAAGAWPGIDFRGAGGYVVAPPSLSAATGRRWTWVQGLVLA